MYKVVLSREAKRYYQRVDVDVARRLAQVFQTLERDLRPPGAKPLHGELEGLWRVRAGGLRVIYEPVREAKEVHVVRIGARGDVY